MFIKEEAINTVSGTLQKLFLKVAPPNQEKKKKREEEKKEDRKIACLQN